jgi:hypothetical protein
MTFKWLSFYLLFGYKSLIFLVIDAKAVTNISCRKSREGLHLPIGSSISRGREATGKYYLE